jgi:acetyl-CoA carboxylase biotin carboxyl carrier protein
MNLENIKSFIELAKSEGVAELKYEEKDLKIEVNFNTSSSQIMAPTYTQAAPSAEVSNQPVKSNYHEVTSPFVGTFYSSASPDKPNYVNVGDKVSNGQTLCILEAMKIMNEIESDISGEIVEICVSNESLVEFGQVLYRVKA